MPAGEIHVGDVATSLRATIYDQDNVVVDVGAADTLQLILKKPDGDITTFTADLYTDGSDGIIEYITTSADDLDQAGIWRLQGKVVIAGATHRSDIITLRVYPNLN